MRWSTPPLAQLDTNECRKTCQPRSTAHLLPATSRRKWSFASLRVSGTHSARRFLLRGTASRWQNRCWPPGWRDPVAQHALQRRRQRHAAERALAADPLLLAEHDRAAREIHVVDPCRQQL